MVKKVGGDEIELTTLVGANGDTHVYQPTPADARAVKEAKLLFVNGLQFEGWLDRLVEAASFDGQTVVATDGIDLIILDEDHDEHEDHDDEEVENHDDNHDHFYNNRAVYVAEIEKLDAMVKEQLSRLPENARTVITSHDAFKYFGRDYELRFLAPQGLSTESEASAKDVVRLITQMREDKIGAVFVESISDPRLIEQIANETGASIGGKLYPGALSASDGREHRSGTRRRMNQPPSHVLDCTPQHLV